MKQSIINKTTKIIVNCQLSIVNFTVTLLISGILFSGCNDIFKDTPVNKLSEESIWKSQLLIDGYVLPWYRNMSHGFSVYMPTSLLLKGTTRDYLPWYGDQLTVGKAEWYSTAYGDILKSNAEEITRRAMINWANCYNQIQSVNRLLENETEMSSDIDRDRVLGEAYFFRAYYYYMLLRQFGGVLLIEKNYNPINSPVKFPRASYQEMVDFIVTDAQKAASYLPAKQIGINLARIEKGAALMLVAKTYLWAASSKFQNSQLSYLGFPDDRSEEMLNKALTAYKEVMKLHYILIPINSTTQSGIVNEYRNIFLTKQSQESIFEVQHSNDGDFDSGFGHKLDREAASPFFTGTVAAYCPTHNHVKEYRMLNGKMYDEAGSGYDANNPYAGRDYRFYANVLYDGCEYRGHIMDLHSRYENNVLVKGVDLTKYAASELAAVTNTGYYMGKFVSDKQKIDNDATYGSKQNYIIWRYAEVLLDYAEISFRLGDAGTALEKVNEIRRRVHVQELPSVSWDDIVNERRIELAFEESTYWDLFRWGIAFTKMNGSKTTLKGIEITKNTNGTTTYKEITVNRADDRIRRFREIQYFLPIPWDEVRYQGITQNPEWIEV